MSFVNEIQAKVNAQEGNSLPVSAKSDLLTNLNTVNHIELNAVICNKALYLSGQMLLNAFHIPATPSGSSAYEKRGIAVDIPVWQPENCIQCNRCSYVCPHAVIRPIAMTAEEAAAAPEGTKMLDGG